ncbi:MAG: phosphoserine transaminase [Microbacteriaceae bacterium]|nr:phosphoserine transaminase [Microbacteriaceae bacterium]MDR9444202.1 phosphoserine transaminase [Microbacteriaceae bacterium]
MAEINIPENLLPADGRFGAGPAKLRKAQIEALYSEGSKIMGTSHRQAPVKNTVKRAQEGLHELFRLPEGYEIILGNGGSTAFWDAAAFSLAENKAQALVHGEFGGKFAKALETPWLEKPKVINADPGSRGDFEPADEFDLYVYPHNETSTGVVTPVHRVGDGLMLTDATSAAGGIDFEITETDAYYFAPQKNLGSDGGIWFAAVSPKAIERIESIATTRYIPAFLDLKTALDNSRLNQTLNTPAVATLYLLAEQVDWMNQNGGLKWASDRTKQSSDMLYQWAEKNTFSSAFVSNPDNRSQVVVTIDFDDTVDASRVAKIMRENGIVDIEPYRKLGRNQLRVATFVNTEPAEVSALIECLDYVIERL